MTKWEDKKPLDFIKWKRKECEIFESNIESEAEFVSNNINVGNLNSYIQLKCV